MSGVSRGFVYISWIILFDILEFIVHICWYLNIYRRHMSETHDLALVRCQAFSYIRPADHICGRVRTTARIPYPVLGIPIWHAVADAQRSTPASYET